MKKGIALLGIAAFAGVASAQAVTGISGGSLFGIYYGASTGDAVGWRFDVNTQIVLTDLGVYNADTDGLTSSHEIGLWDSSGTLLTSGTAGPGGMVVGSWTYTDVADVTLTVGERYTIAAVYTALDGDSYLSGPSSVSLAPEINSDINGVFPDAGNLGLTFPGMDSANLGRFGPNFLFVPAPGAMALLGLGGLAAARRRR